jgi:type II secretory pathway pseudopilin PulG
MKRNFKSMLGVTLLEIMLVLAIAAMVIVMSIRYYQSATSSQQANAALQQIQAVTAAIDSIAQGAGGYTTSNIASPNVLPLLPKNGLTTPWNSQITIGAPSSPTTYEVTVKSTPAAVCPILKAKLAVNSHYSGFSACGAAGSTPADFTYTYNSSS